jgi:hypothetical protein
VSLSVGVVSGVDSNFNVLVFIGVVIFMIIFFVLLVSVVPFVVFFGRISLWPNVISTMSSKNGGTPKVFVRKQNMGFCCRI